MINILTWPTPLGMLDVTHSKSRGIFKLEFRANGIYTDTQYMRAFGNGDIYQGDDFDYVYPVGTSDAILSRGPKFIKIISEGCGRSAVKMTYEITTHGSKHLLSIKIPEVRDEEIPPKIVTTPLVRNVGTKTGDVVAKKIEVAREQSLDLVIMLTITFVLMVLVDFIQFAVFSVFGIKVPWLVFYILLNQTSYYPLGLLLHFGLKNLH